MSSLSTTCLCSEYVLKVKWQISNFSTRAAPGTSKKYLRSDSFNLYKSRLSFHLRFYPTNKKDGTHAVVVLIANNFNNEKPVKVGFKIYIENLAGDQIGNKSETSYKFDAEGSGCGNQFPYNELYPPENGFIKDDDTIFVHCELKCNSDNPGFKAFDLNETFGKRLLEEHQLDKSGMCVAEIGNKRLKLDRSILTTQSDVFATMLNGNYVEGQTNVIQIKDVESDALEEFFSSFYTHQIVDSKNAKSLFVLADKYSVKWLKTECEEILGKDLSMENVFDCLNLAITYRCVLLKKELINFISKRKNFEQIIEKNEWNTFALEEKEFSNQILKAGFKNLKDATIQLESGDEELD